MKDPTPEQSIRAAVTVVMLHALLGRSELSPELEPAHAVRHDDALVDRALSLADKVIAKVFP